MSSSPLERSGEAKRPLGHRSLDIEKVRKKFKEGVIEKI